MVVCPRCGAWIPVEIETGYYPNPGEETTITCPICGKEIKITT